MKTKQSKKSTQMRNYLLLLLLFTGMVNAQIVNIPDPNFKAYLLSANTTTYEIAHDELDNPMVIDANGDSEIQNAEAEAVYWLSVNSDTANSDTIQSVIGILA